MKNVSPSDFFDQINDEMDKKFKEMGVANILIAGRSGVGKSTLINTVFGGDFAETGQGRPVTQETRRITKSGVPVALYDTRGLEMNQFKETLKNLTTFLEKNKAQTDAQDHIHAAWVCISEDSRRVEEGEEKLVELLCQYQIPVIVVITKARADNGFKDEVRKITPLASQHLRVRALSETHDDGHVLPSTGVVELIRATDEILPQAKKDAFVAAQKMDLRLKESKCHKIVATAAVAAATAGASPIPFSDAVILIPIQISMIAGITVALGISLDKAAMATVAASAVGCAATSIAGRTIVVNLIKLIPGAGSVVGGVISGGTAAALTTALGELYLSVIVGLMQNGRQPTAQEIESAFKAKWAARKE